MSLLGDKPGTPSGPGLWPGQLQPKGVLNRALLCAQRQGSLVGDKEGTAGKHR